MPYLLPLAGYDSSTTGESLPNDTELFPDRFYIENVPLLGVMSGPLVVASVLTLARKKVIPRIGDEALR